MALSLAAMLVFVSAAPAWAQLSATATISTAQTSAPFNYTIQLHNTGTTTIGTLWFAWIPLGPTYNFLSSQASNITVPTGWTGFSTGTAFGGDGYGIEMYDIGGSGDLIASGGNATFGFTDSESHTQLMQNANFITSDKVTTSFIYVNSPEGDPGFQFNVQVVPEPSGMVLAGLGGLAGLTIWRRRRAAAA